jgi:diacylglycerol kinase family enzyme
VFALEHRLPLNLAEAWQTVLHGREHAIDLGRAAYQTPDGGVTRYFLQLAGAGLDAHAVYLLNWRLKKRLGKGAYVLAALEAWRKSRDRFEVCLGGQKFRARWVLVGNGAYYAGKHRIFPRAQTDDGRLDICLFERLDMLFVLRCGLRLLRGAMLDGPGVTHLQGESFAIASDTRAHLEIDGEYAGILPATFSVLPRALRLICP